MVERIEALEEDLKKVSSPLPGSIAQENRRPLNIPAALDRHTLLDALEKLFPQIERSEWEARCEAGRFVNYGGKVRCKDHVVRAGERILQIFPPDAEPDVATDIRILHLDEAVMLIRKPAPLPMHASGRFHRNTLQHLLNLACAPHVPRPVHRLDSNTTGIVLFARTRHFCRVLQRQFLDGTVVKRYLVGVAGHPPQDHFSCDAPISADPDQLGTHRVDKMEGLPSSTDFRVLERRADGTSLLEATLKTGRTNQIRIHLWHLGFPVLGDPAYLANGELGDTQTLDAAATAMQLHSWQLSFSHPRTGKKMEFETERPEWAK
jgi:RluA family pseudouridine synthase